MFFHTHVYYSKRVDKNLNALKVIGSFFPDFASTKLITWDDLHKKKEILEFFEHVRKSAPEFESLLKGINYHNTLDYFTHIEYKDSTPGYVYKSITPELINFVKESLHIDDARARVSSHNLIEAGVEYHLLSENPDLENLVRDSIKEIDLRGMIKFLSVFYKQDEQAMLNGFKKFFVYATGYDLKNIDEWARLSADFNKFHLNIDADKELTKKAIELSVKLTKNTYKEFLETVIVSKDTEIKDCN